MPGRDHVGSMVIAKQLPEIRQLVDGIAAPISALDQRERRAAFRAEQARALERAMTDRALATHAAMLSWRRAFSLCSLSQTECGRVPRQFHARSRRRFGFAACWASLSVMLKELPATALKVARAPAVGVTYDAALTDLPRGALNEEKDAPE